MAGFDAYRQALLSFMAPSVPQDVSWHQDAPYMGGLTSTNAASQTPGRPPASPTWGVQSQNYNVGTPAATGMLHSVANSWGGGPAKPPMGDDGVPGIHTTNPSTQYVQGQVRGLYARPSYPQRRLY